MSNQNVDENNTTKIVGPNESIINEKENEEAKQSKRRCKVWDEFSIENTPNGPKAKCNHCKHLLSASSKSGTAHLTRHLEHACNKRPNKDIRQMLLSNSARDEIKCFTFNLEHSRRLFAKLIIYSELSFLFAENPVLTEWIKSLQPLYNIVGRKTVKKDCLAYYESEKKKIQNSLQKLTSRVCFTTDLWTSNQKLGYMVITAHYIDDGFILNKRIISFKKLAYPHTSFVIEDALEKCIYEWDLDEKVFAITLDNCSTNDSMIRRFRDKFIHKLRFNGDYVHIRCCAHILNIMVQDGMRIIRDAIENIREIIRYVTVTPSRMQVFNDMAKQMRFPPKKGFALDVATRWNSTFYMLRDALSYKDVLNRNASEYYNNCPSSKEWKKIETISKFLESFHDATKVFSGTKYPTANFYFKEVWEIRTVLSDGRLATDETIKQLTIEMQKNLISIGLNATKCC